MNAPGFNLRLARDCAAAAAAAYGRQTIGSEMAHALVCREETSAPIIIAFRGTAERLDWVIDADVRRVNTGVGCVHAGFWRAAQSIMGQVRKLDQTTNPAPVVLTGHSLGGALAVLVAWLMVRESRPVSAVITFGGPRVGDARWRESYNGAGKNIQHPTSNIEQPTLGEVTWRLVNAEDIVARVPGWLLGWRHVGREVFLPTMGGMRIRCALWFKLLSDIAGTLAAWSQGHGVAQLQRHPVARYVEAVGKI